MLELLRPEIARYLARLPSHDDPVLRRMERQAAREEFPIVGPKVGQVLMLLARAIGAKRIFEMGSGFGYSGLWFAKALPKDGRITFTDISAQRSRQARHYMAQAHQQRKVTYLVGDAIALIRRARGPFDVIFLDADKARYPLAFKAAWPKLRRGGLFIADNLHWSGLVAKPRPDVETRGILAMTRLLYTTPGLISSILPLRDGVSVTLKVR